MGCVLFECCCPVCNVSSSVLCCQQYCPLLVCSLFLWINGSKHSILTCNTKYSIVNMQLCLWERMLERPSVNALVGNALWCRMWQNKDSSHKRCVEIKALYTKPSHRSTTCINKQGPVLLLNNQHVKRGQPGSNLKWVPWKYCSSEIAKLWEIQDRSSQSTQPTA